MRPRSGVFISAFLVVLAMFAGEVHAMSEGRTPIRSLNTSQTPPFIITTPGHYILFSNIINVASGPAIIVDSDCVEINLNGKTITHGALSPVLGDHLIEIVDGRTDVTIRDGWLVGGYRGINYEPAPPQNTGMRVRIRDVVIRQAADRGISISGAGNAELVSNQVHDISGPYGIYVSGSGDSFTGRFVENTVEDVDQFGINLEGLEGGDVIRNVVRRFNLTAASATGILIDGLPQFVGGNLIKENTISAGSGNGLFIGDASFNNLIEGNVIYDNTGLGMDLGASNGNKIRNNTIGNNGGDGIFVNTTCARNLIEDNHIESNAGAGIQFLGTLTDNVCRDNTVQANSPDWTGSRQINLGGNLPASLCL